MFYSELDEMWDTLKANHREAYGSVHNNMCALRDCHSALKNERDESATEIVDLRDEIEELKDVVASYAIELLHAKK